MICPYCRQQTPDSSPFCTSCGVQVAATPNAGNPFGNSNNPYEPSQFTPAPSNPSDDKALRWVVPIGTSFWCIASGYTGLISFGCCILGPIAIITGVLGLKELKRNPNISGKGRAIFGIIAGVLTTLAMIFFLAAMYIEWLNKP